MTTADSFNFRYFLETHPDFEQTEGVDFSGTGSGIYHAREGELDIVETEDKIEVKMGDSVIFVAERKLG
jgi:hypothetical protein